MHKYYKLKITGEIIIPVIVLVFTLGYFFETKELRSESLLLAKPLVFLCFFLSLFIFFKNGIKIINVRSSSTDNNDLAVSLKLKIKNSLFSNKKAILTIISFIIYILVINWLGFYLTSSLYLCSQLFLLGERKLSKIIIITLVVVVLFIYPIFNIWMKTPFPVGILFTK